MLLEMAMQLVKLVDDLTFNMNNKEVMAAVLLEMVNAFDIVWYDGLL